MGPVLEDNRGIEAESGHTPLLVIGAGPYALSTAAHAKRQGLDPLVAGEPMGFWRGHMPERMLLRSGTDWHLDADGIETFEAFLAERGVDPAEVPPVPLGTFLEYTDWFCARTGIDPRRTFVARLEKTNGRFVAEFDDGSRLSADAVVAAPGIAPFPVIPDWVPASLPESRWSHTSTLVEFEHLEGARVLIVGGRQSAFEWAALLAEAGAASVHVVHRHDPPAFEASHWSFVDELMDTTIRVPGWFRGLPAAERDAIAGRFWAEGRLKLEPWLTPRLPWCTAGHVARSRPAAKRPPARSRWSSPAASASSSTTCCSPPATDPTWRKSGTSSRSSTRSRRWTASPCSTSTSRRACRASSCPASWPRATSAPSSASSGAARPPRP
jgi:Pyridine nucleotide-disulphide oxidoreductase